jgi:hypothetical protein
MIFFSKTAISAPMFVEQLKIVKNYLKGLTLDGRKLEMKTLRTDYAKPYMAKAATDYLTEQGLEKQSSAPY